MDIFQLKKVYCDLATTNIPLLERLLHEFSSERTSMTVLK